MIRVIVAGSRTFNNFEKLEYELMMYFKAHQLHRKDIEIVSGTARGADRLGEVFAKKYELKLTRIPAEWDKYGKSAGYIRNTKMAEYAGDSGVLFAFWDMQSKGTKHMIDIANKYNLFVNIININ